MIQLLENIGTLLSNLANFIISAINNIATIFNNVIEWIEYVITIINNIIPTQILAFCILAIFTSVILKILGR